MYSSAILPLCSYRKPRAEDIVMSARFGYQRIVTDLEEQNDLEPPQHHVSTGGGHQSQGKSLLMEPRSSDTE